MKSKIALCFSGEMRWFDRCIDNILETLINPLKEEFDVDIFLSTWVDDNDSIKEIIISKLKPVVFEQELKRDSFFRNNYSNPNYKKNSLMCVSTPRRASSMWFKVSKSNELMLDYSEKNNIEYSCVFRLRPDIIYNEKINIELVKESINNDSIYMSKWNGLYEAVTFKLSDHFSFGSLKVMNVFQSVFENIKTFNEKDITCSAEGYLNEQIKDIDLKRIDFSYSVQRENKIENVT